MDSVDELLLLSLKRVGVPFLLEDSQRSATKSQNDGDLADENKEIIVSSVKQLSVEQVVSCVGYCLRIILNDESIPSKFPVGSGVGTKHRICSQLAEKVKEVGYPKECGYNQLLYPVEKETRGLLSWIVEKLPRDCFSNETKPDLSEVESKSDLRLRKIKSSLEIWSQKTWVPFSLASRFTNIESSCCGFKTRSIRLPGDYANTSDYDEFFLPSLHEQCCQSPKILISSLLELDAIRSYDKSQGCSSKRGDSNIHSMTMKLKANSLNTSIDQTKQRKGNDKEEKHESDIHDLQARDTGGVFSRAVKYSQEYSIGKEEDLGDDVMKASKEEDEQDIEERYRQELKDLEEDLKNSRKCVDVVDEGIRKVEIDLDNHKKVIAEAMEEEISLEAVLKLKRKVLQMLPNAEQNIGTLENIVKKSEQKLIDLATEWDRCRTPLEEEIKDRIDNIEKRREKFIAFAKRIKIMKEEINHILDESKIQDERISQLEVNYANLPKDINRSLYTARILDIIKQVRKQNDQIDFIITDIMAIQKDINVISQKLTRTEAIADETVYSVSDQHKSLQKSKKDSGNVQSYKLLIEMRQIFDDLVETVRETGKTENQARDFETRTENLAARFKTKRLEQILTDLSQIEQENDDLKLKLESMPL